MKCVQIKISGRVQRVGFRYSTLNIANEYGVKGFVCNRSDGSVYIEAEGTETAIRLFADWCHKGSRLANVTNTEINDMKPKHYDNFTIK